MSNKQVLVYGVLESTNDLRSVFVGHIHFKKLTKFRKFIETFHCCMTRLRNTNLGVFIQCQYRRTTLSSSCVLTLYKYIQIRVPESGHATVKYFIVTLKF